MTSKKGNGKSKKGNGKRIGVGWLDTVVVGAPVDDVLFDGFGF
jgi:hypothetical protein